jgi:hypothetical protein
LLRSTGNNEAGYWKKRLSFLLLFFVLPICLNKYRPLPLFVYELISKTPENTVIPSDFTDNPISTPVKKCPKPPVCSYPEEKSLAMRPIEANSIMLSVEPIPLDTATLLSEMKQLRVNPLEHYRIRKLYIPPVEYKLNPKELILPLSLIAIGVAATNTEKFKDILPIERPNPKNRSTSFDDAFQLVPTPSLFLFDAIGKEKHHPIDQAFIAALSYGLMVYPVRYIKARYNTPRPYGGNHSFPSGHTATAFVGSHMIYKEFKDSNPWIAYTGYALGAITAGARIVHDKHWVCDVMAGAGIAILSTELAYLIYFPIRNFIAGEINKLFDKYLIISPVIYPNSAGLSLSLQF